MDNFDLRKYLAEGKLYEAINLDIEDDIAILSGDSGEYEGEIEDGKASFSVIYDDLDYRISDQYNENNIEDFLGKDHAFVELAKKYDHKWGIERDLVGITIIIALWCMLKSSCKFEKYFVLYRKFLRGLYNKLL